MASTITITCPECDKQMKAPAGVIGKKIRCKSCGNVFPARAAKAAAPKKAGPKKDDDDEDASPYGITEDTFTPRCPQCANELESRDAVICLHCGYNIVTREKARMRKVRDITGWDKFVWLLPGIVCALVVVLLITGDIVYCVKIQDWIDIEAWYFFIAHLGIKIWLVLITIGIMYLAGKFAVRRLIFNYTPPEIEERY
jgi:DNA-directed RNA polymerase subunit M/transcription elongation factor TFIIS